MGVEGSSKKLGGDISWQLAGFKTEIDDLLGDLELAVCQTSYCDKTPGQQRDTSEGLTVMLFYPPDSTETHEKLTGVLEHKVGVWHT